MADNDNQPSKKQKTDDVETMGISEMKALTMFMGTPPCMREDGPMDLAEYICEAGDGMTVNLLDRPAEQIAGLWDDEVRDAGLVNTIRRGLRELGLSA